MSTDDKKTEQGSKSTGTSKPKQQTAETSDPLAEQEATGLAARGDGSAQINQ